MQSTKKQWRGQIVVVAILAIAMLAAGLGWRRYAREHPSALRALLVNSLQVAAEFDPPTAVLLKPGMRATVSIGRRKFIGSLSHGSNYPPHSTILIDLHREAIGVPSGSSCEVTVDLTVPPGLLKDVPKPHASSN